MVWLFLRLKPTYRYLELLYHIIGQPHNRLMILINGGSVVKRPFIGSAESEHSARAFLPYGPNLTIVGYSFYQIQFEFLAQVTRYWMISGKSSSNFSME